MTRIKVRLLAALLLAAFAFQCGLFITSASSTWDETHYLGLGKYLLQQRQWDVRGAIIHAPLSSYLGSLPLLFAPVDVSGWEKTKTPDDLTFLGSSDILRGQAILSSPENSGDRLLYLTRIPFVILGMLLGCFVFRFGAELYGVRGGILSLFLYSCCPNLIAFSGLAVPDLPLTLFSFMFVYFLWRVFRQGDKRGAWGAALALGLALLSKYTALLLIPAGLCICLLQPVEKRKGALVTGLMILAGAFFILLAGYFFDLTPYLLGLKLQLFHSGTADVFLMGENSTAGWWYYYPVAFALKTPVPVMALLVIALCIAVRHYRKEWRDTLFLLIPVAAFFTFFMVMPKCTGLRYILPVYPFIHVMIGKLAEQSRRMQLLTGALALWSAASVISISPHYLAYFNELAGGPDNGHKYLVDSNLDWGQDLKGLKRYMERSGIARVSLSYFGSDSPERYGIAYDWLPSYLLVNRHPEESPRIDRNRYLAISVTNLHGTSLEDKEQFTWLLRHEPAVRIGHSIFVYDLAAIPGGKQ